jgi:hypothetical protein
MPDGRSPDIFLFSSQTFIDRLLFFLPYLLKQFLSRLIIGTSLSPFFGFGIFIEEFILKGYNYN